MNQIGPASPFLITADLSASLAFYQGDLGWDVYHTTPDPVPFFAIVGQGEAQIMLKEIGEGVKPLPNASRHADAPWDVFIYKPDPDATHAAAPLCPGPKLRDDGLYGFAIEDPDGYVMYFGRPIQG